MEALCADDRPDVGTDVTTPNNVCESANLTKSSENSATATSSTSSKVTIPNNLPSLSITGALRGCKYC
ncbi:MAG: hypothetical protein QW102_03210 [Candidatus Nezhaarchaeales archaeon]